MKVIAQAVAFLVALGSAGDAKADCVPKFAGSDSAVTISGVSVEPGGVATGMFQIRASNGGVADEGGCSATLRLSRVSSTGGQTFPKYTLRTSAGSEVVVASETETGAAASAGIRLTNLPSSGPGQSTSIQVRVPTEWGVAAGNFADQLLVTLYDQQGVARDRATVNVAISIPAAVAVRLAGAIVDGGDITRIDLGNLSAKTESRSTPFVARVLSTSPYSISLQSENTGFLKRTDGNELIHYDLYFAGRKVNFAEASSYTSMSHTPASGDVNGMLIVVPAALGSTKPYEAGSYSDRITILVSAL